MSDDKLNPFLGRKRDNPGELEPVDPDDHGVYDETETNADAVPAGSAKEVLEWVGDDKGRAQQALEAEHARDDGGRKGLTASLEGKLNS